MFADRVALFLVDRKLAACTFPFTVSLSKEKKVDPFESTNNGWPFYRVS